jgi:hypothetical protein
MHSFPQLNVLILTVVMMAAVLLWASPTAPPDGKTLVLGAASASKSIALS